MRRPTFCRPFQLIHRPVTDTSAAPPLPPEAAAPPVHDALALTKGGTLAHLVLDGQVYSLRITRQGKLILTK